MEMGAVEMREGNAYVLARARRGGFQTRPSRFRVAMSKIAGGNLSQFAGVSINKAKFLLEVKGHVNSRSSSKISCKSRPGAGSGGGR